MTSKARTARRPAGAKVACDGAEEEREGLLPYFFSPMAPLLLLSAVISGLDAGVRRKKRGRRVRTQPSGWWAFMLPVPPPPAASLKTCADCGATQTPQWRAGPEGLGSLFNTCGVRRRADGERWGVPRRRPLPAARTVPNHPPPQEGLPQPDLQSQQSIRICEQQEQPSPAQIPASESSPPETASGKPVKRKSPSPTGPATPSTESKKPAPRNKKNHPADKRCKHCRSSGTPQWREGPKGPRTLCNACGMRHRQGRLLPEYRPKASPTFNKEKHASLHIEVLELRRQRKNKQPQQPVQDDSQCQDVDLMMGCVGTLRQPVPRPVDRELRVGCGDDDSASKAGAPGMDEPSWEFLIGGPPAPMFIEPEGPCVIFID